MVKNNFSVVIFFQLNFLSLSDFSIKESQNNAKGKKILGSGMSGSQMRNLPHAPKATIITLDQQIDIVVSVSFIKHYQFYL